MVTLILYKNIAFF